MDKSLDKIKQLDERPLDELGDVDEMFEDMMAAAETIHSQTQHIALVCDATGSMQSVWDRASSALRDAVDYIQANAACPIAIQVVAYRDHIEDSNVIETSTWSNDARYLKDFISRIVCSGGGDYPESVGHGLGTIHKQQVPVKQIILIGDAPGKEGSFGYAEAQAFGQQNCPIYALYTDTDKRLVEAFTKIARLSGGKATYLGINSDLSDVFKAIFASNKALQITYQATSIEAKNLT